VQRGIVFFTGGHGLHSTACDYGRFLRAILRGGELDGARVLSPATVDLAFSDQLNGLPLPDLIPTRAPWLIHDVVALPFRQTWGFGFQLMLDGIPGMRRQGAGFWSGILNTHFWAPPPRVGGLRALTTGSAPPAPRSPAPGPARGRRRPDGSTADRRRR
jgi:methyl acetate hydrolase